MSVGSPTAGTWFSSQWRPDNEFETDRVKRAFPNPNGESNKTNYCKNHLLGEVPELSRLACVSASHIGPTLRTWALQRGGSQDLVNARQRGGSVSDQR